jgi:two-component system, sensor histidine kinase and response regulator
MLRVLIADRNSFYRRVVRQNLMPGRACEMAEVETPLDAISLLLSQPFDLLIADWEVLILNDGGLLELVVRRAKLARRPMPVMAMMANPTQSSVLHASNNAVDMVLRKPFSPKQLQQRVTWLLGRAEIDVAS